jgi:hypothetical protein
MCRRITSTSTIPHRGARGSIRSCLLGIFRVNVECDTGFCARVGAREGDKLRSRGRGGAGARDFELGAFGVD